ncbi:hypothetical protein ABVK25_007443 [Lepraria finkii]|uniref:Uncharacterized protein n=1 Tax=Lepraria finkii TaxID=1340010 RepID=A0ABR4B363_9LECA
MGAMVFLLTKPLLTAKSSTRAKYSTADEMLHTAIRLRGAVSDFNKPVYELSIWVDGLSAACLSVDIRPCDPEMKDLNPLASFCASPLPSPVLQMPSEPTPTFLASCRGTQTVVPTLSHSVSSSSGSK